MIAPFVSGPQPMESPSGNALATDDATSRRPDRERQVLGPPVLDDQDDSGAPWRERLARQGDVVLPQQAPHLALDVLQGRQLRGGARLDDPRSTVLVRRDDREVEDPD